MRGCRSMYRISFAARASCSITILGITAGRSDHQSGFLKRLLSRYTNRMNGPKNEDEPLAGADRCFRQLLRYRALSSAALLILGTSLLYSGFDKGNAALKAFGVLFVLYAGIIQVRSWSVKRFVREVQSELNRKTG